MRCLVIPGSLAVSPLIGFHEYSGKGADKTLSDVFLKNVYMATNSRDKTISLSARTDGRGSSTVSVADTLAANASATGTGQAHSGASALTSTSWLAMGLLMTTITAACML